MECKFHDVCLKDIVHSLIIIDLKSYCFTDKEKHVSFENKIYDLSVNQKQKTSQYAIFPHDGLFSCLFHVNINMEPIKVLICSHIQKLEIESFSDEDYKRERWYLSGKGIILTMYFYMFNPHIITAFGSCYAKRLSLKLRN